MRENSISWSNSLDNGRRPKALVADRDQRASHRQLAAGAVVAGPLKRGVRLRERD